MLDGEPHRLGGLGAIRSASIEESPAACAFVLPGKDIVVRGRVSAPEKDFVGWVYADPKGPEHNTVNCSVADLELTVERPGLPPRELTLAGRRRLRAGDAGDRPRHPDPALPGRLSAVERSGSAAAARGSLRPRLRRRRFRRPSRTIAAAARCSLPPDSARAPLAGPSIRSPATTFWKVIQVS